MAKYKYRGIVHRIAHCKDCDWQEDNYITALEKARVHSKKTGHTIAIETGTCGDMQP